jgi:hypothetical protein
MLNPTEYNKKGRLTPSHPSIMFHQVTLHDLGENHRQISKVQSYFEIMKA